MAILKISILARILDKSDFGLVAIIGFILGFTNMFMDMGIAAAILHKQNISKNQYDSLYSYNLLSGLFLYILIYLFSNHLAVFYNEHELEILIPLMGFNLIFSSIGLQHKIILQKNLQLELIAKIEIIGISASFFIATGFAFLGYGVYALVYSSLFQYGFSNLAFAIIGFKKNKFSWRFHFNEAKPFLIIGGYQVGGQIVNFFNKELDVLIIGKMLGAETLGSYHLAKQLASRPAQVVNPIINKVAAPLLAKIQFNHKKLKLTYLEIIQSLSFINFPIYFGLAVLSKPVIVLFYGESFLEISFIFQILCFYMMIRSIGNPIGSLIIAKGRTDLDLLWNMLILLTMPIATFLAAKVSVEVVVKTHLFLMILYYIPSWRILVFNLISATLKEYFSRSFLALVISGIMAFLVKLIFPFFLEFDYFLQIIIGASIGFIIYGLGIFICVKIFKYEIIPKFHLE